MRDSTYGGELTVFDLEKYHYCPRKVYFWRTAGVPVVPTRKMTGGRTDERREEKRRWKERKEIYGMPREKIKKVMHRVYLRSEKLRLSGILDVMLETVDGDMIPLDMKFTDRPYVTREWKKQLTAYAMLIEDQTGRKVATALLYFTKQNRTERIEITQQDKQFVLKDLEDIRKLIASERLPRKTNPKKCGYCEFRRYCGEE